MNKGINTYSCVLCTSHASQYNPLLLPELKCLESL